MVIQRRGRPPYDDVLSPAEWKVAELVRHGMTNRQIAVRMGVSMDAIKFHVSNALGKLGFSGRSELRQWSGVAKETALYRMWRFDVDVAGGENMQGSEPYLMLAQVARTVASAERSRAWYRDILGLTELYSFPGMAFFDLGGVRLMLSEEATGSAKSESLLYLQVPDLHAAKEALEQRGVKFTHAPHMIHRHGDGTEEWMAFFEDDEGRPMGLVTKVHNTHDQGETEQEQSRN